MHYFDGFAQNGFSVVGIDAATAPNPRCCSDPNVLCPTCAALALRRAGVTGNAANGGLVCNSAVDPDDILELPEPTIVANAGPCAAVKRELAHVMNLTANVSNAELLAAIENDANRDLLLPPVTVANAVYTDAELCRKFKAELRRRLTANDDDEEEDNDLLIPPVINWAEAAAQNRGDYEPVDNDILPLPSMQF